MKDVAGRELKVGQIVAFAEKARGSSAKGFRASLTTATIVGLTAQKVRLSGGEVRFPTSVAVVQEPVH